MRILIAHPEVLIAQGLQRLLEDRGHEVPAVATRRDETVAQMRALEPECLLLDDRWTGLDGEFVHDLAADFPDTAVIVLSSGADDETLMSALRAGARGCLSTRLPEKRFATLLEGVENGVPALPAELARPLLDEFTRMAAEKDRKEADLLTPRERDILHQLVSGVTSNRALARRLELSENTVKFHMAHILDKLHLHSRAEVVGYALRHHLVPLDEDKEAG